MSSIDSGAAKFRHAMFDNSASPYKEDYQPVYHTDTKVHKLGCFVLFYFFLTSITATQLERKW